MSGIIKISFIHTAKDDMMKLTSKRRLVLDLIILAALLTGLLSCYWLNQPAQRLNREVSGWYELQSTVPTDYPPAHVKAILYIPSRYHLSQRPLVVYYHGGTTNPDEYKNIGFLADWAEEKNFLILSVQNRWALNNQQDTDKTISDSLNATEEFISRLVQYGHVDPRHIYTTGFSGGGFLALCAGIRHPNRYAGIADFKGNFYQLVFDEVINKTDYQTRLKSKDLQRLRIFVCLGGPNDAPRVQSQVPLALNYLASEFGKYAIYMYFPDEGHNLTKRDFEAFWEGMHKP